MADSHSNVCYIHHCHNYLGLGRRFFANSVDSTPRKTEGLANLPHVTQPGWIRRSRAWLQAALCLLSVHRRYSQGPVSSIPVFRFSFCCLKHIPPGRLCRYEIPDADEAPGSPQVRHGQIHHHDMCSYLGLLTWYSGICIPFHGRYKVQRQRKLHGWHLPH